MSHDGAVLHLRLRVPGDLTDEVVELLTADETVTNVAVVAGGFTKPDGCLVLADVARENATGVIKQLRDLDVQHRGSISVDEIDTILSDEAARVERAAPGAPDDGVVWVSVEQRLRDDSRLSFAFIAFMTLAALIAGVGRINDQPILIVGAMVVGPEFSPIAAICFALAHPRFCMLPEPCGPWPPASAWQPGSPPPSGRSPTTWAPSPGPMPPTGNLTDFIVRPDGWSFVVALPGRGRRHAVADDGQVRPARRRVHLGHHDPCRRHPGRVPGVRGLVRGRLGPRTARVEPARHRRLAGRSRSWSSVWSGSVSRFARRHSLLR